MNWWKPECTERTLVLTSRNWPPGLQWRAPCSICTSLSHGTKDADSRYCWHECRTAHVSEADWNWELADLRLAHFFNGMVLRRKERALTGQAR